MQVTPSGKHLMPSRRAPKGTVAGPDGKHYDFNHYKACGNALYVKGEYAAAAKSYSTALEAVGGTVQGEWVGEVMSSPEKQRSGLLADRTGPARARSVSARFRSDWMSSRRR